MPRTNLTTHLPGLKPLTTGRNISYIANELGINQSTLHKLVDCERGASLAMALQIAKYFRVRVEDLVKERPTSAV